MKSHYHHPTSIVESDAIIGVGTKIWHFAHIRSNARIGANVIIGKGCYIDENVNIGDNVKIQNFVSVYNGVTIEDDVFIGPHVTFTNDLFPRATGEWKIIPTTIRSGVSIGANATIICGITIHTHAFIGAGSVVTKSVPKNGFVVGNPARLIGYVCKCARKILPSDTLAGDYDIVCNYCGYENNISIKS